MAISIEVIIFLILVFVTTRKNRLGSYFQYLPYLVIFVFMAIRYDYGDGDHYREIFYFLHRGVKVSGIEPLYELLNKALPNFEMVVVVTSLIYVIAVYLIASRVLTFEQRGFALCILALHPYILMVDMSAVRQSVAIALILIGVYIANEKRAILFIPFCLIAALFHKSAIAVLPLVFLFKRQHFSQRTKWVILGITVFFLLVPEKLFDILNRTLIALKLNTANYLSYLNSGYENSGMAVILSLAVMAFFFLFGDAVEEKNAIYVKASILAMVFEALQGRVQTLGRIEMYFVPFFMISIPLIVKNEKRTLKTNIFGNVVVLDYGSYVAESCFIMIFVWKFVRFMTPQFAYYSIFTAA